jgi:uncharacterized membrane protein YraQ (UPF0718 family)
MALARRALLGPLRLLLVLLLHVLLHEVDIAAAHPSCCTKHLLPYVPDLDELPPDVYLNEPRMIPDPRPDNVKPDYWDDEDDGPWEPDEIPNPAFAWKPKLIPNPNYNPPLLVESLQLEINKALPWVVLGVFVTAALDAAQLSVSSLKGVLQHAGPVGGAMIGLATPLCSCGSLPVAAGFAAGGVPLRVVVAFLTATQSAGLDSAAITWGLLGPQAALYRLAGAVILSVAAGLAVPSTAPTNAVPMSAQPGTAAGQPVNPLVTLGYSAVRTAGDIFPSVLCGLCLSTVVVHYVPHLATAYQALKISGAVDDGAVNSTSSATMLTSELVVRLSVLGSAMPLQLCEHSTVAYAAAIQKAGGAPGLAFAFLLVAPATNLPSMLLLLRTHGHGKLMAARVTFTLTIVALVLSFAVDVLALDMLVEKEADEGGGGMLELPSWHTTSSPWVAGALVLAAGAKSAREFFGSADSHQHGKDCCEPDKVKKS